MVWLPKTQAIASDDPREHTYGHLDCPACDRARTVTLARITPSLTFAEASALWLSSRSLDPSLRPIRARFIRANTEKSYRQYIDSLDLFFGNLRLDQVHLGHLRSYQEARVTGAPPFIRKRRPNKNVIAGPCPAAPKKANQELALLKAIMRRAGCWSQELDEYYEPFQEEIADVPRALLAEDQKKWLDVALTQRRWWLVYWYSVLAFETSMSTNEIRSLRIGDVNLFHGIVSVPDAGAKNSYRARTLPLLSADVKWSAEQLLARAQDLGAAAPTDFLFPYRRPPKPFDPTRPMSVSGIKKLWDEVRIASGLKGFRPYDTRHTAITRWAEAGMNIADIMVMAGHMNRKMTLHYTHICGQAKRRQLEEVAARMGPKTDRAGSFGAPFYISDRRA
jgi:integrase